MTLDQPELLVSLEELELLEELAQQVLLDLQDKLEQPVLLVLLEEQDLLELQELLVELVNLEQPDALVLQESLEPPEGRDNLEKLDARGQLVIQEVVEHLDEQEQQVSLEELGLL